MRRRSASVNRTVVDLSLSFVIAVLLTALHIAVSLRKSNRRAINEGNETAKRCRRGIATRRIFTKHVPLSPTWCRSVDRPERDPPPYAEYLRRTDQSWPVSRLY